MGSSHFDYWSILLALALFPDYLVLVRLADALNFRLSEVDCRLVAVVVLSQSVEVPLIYWTGVNPD